MDPWIIFITGLTVGGVSCMAVQGGLLASVIAAKEKSLDEEEKSKVDVIIPVTSFIVTKTIAYTLLGFLLGFFGQAVSLTDTVRHTLQILAGIYMVIIGLHLLNVHPLFRYAVIQPPYFLSKRIRKESRSSSIFAPAILGAMTIFIPCGTTLAMEALAITSGNALSGGLIMLIYTIGTIPAFFGLGFLTSFLGANFKKNFLKIAAVIVLFLGASSINGVLVASGSSFSVQSLLAASPIQISSDGTEEEYQGALSGDLLDGVRTVDITVNAKGYSPAHIVVKQGEKIKLNLKTNGVYSCASAFRIPALKIARDLPPTGVETIEFTANNKGKILYACSMGMYTGVLEVI